MAEGAAIPAALLTYPPQAGRLHRKAFRVEKIGKSAGQWVLTDATSDPKLGGLPVGEESPQESIGN